MVSRTLVFTLRLPPSLSLFFLNVAPKLKSLYYSVQNTDDDEIIPYSDLDLKQPIYIYIFFLN